MPQSPELSIAVPAPSKRYNQTFNALEPPNNLSAFRSYHLVYIDESGCDNRIVFRQTGWSPLGVTPVQIARLHRDQRHQILPAYAQDGIVLARVFQGSTDTAVFEDFIEQLLHHCGRWPEPKSVLNG